MLLLSQRLFNQKLKHHLSETRRSSPVQQGRRRLLPQATRKHSPLSFHFTATPTATFATRSFFRPYSTIESESESTLEECLRNRHAEDLQSSLRRTYRIDQPTERDGGQKQGPPPLVEPEDYSWVIQTLTEKKSWQLLGWWETTARRKALYNGPGSKDEASEVFIRRPNDLLRKDVQPDRLVVLFLKRGCYLDVVQRLTRLAHGSLNFETVNRAFTEIGRSDRDDKLEISLELAKSLSRVAEERKLKSLDAHRKIEGFARSGLALSFFTAGHTAKAIQLLEHMKAEGYPVHANVYALYFKSLPSDTSEEVDSIYRLYRDIFVRQNFEMSTLLYNVLLAKFSSDLERVREILERMKKKNVAPTSITYTTAMNAATEGGDEAFAISLFNEAVAVLPSLKRLDDRPFRSLIRFYASRYRNQEAALEYRAKTLDGAKSLTVSAKFHDALLTAYTWAVPVLPSNAEAVLDEMMNSRQPILGKQYAKLVRTYAIAGDFERAAEVVQGRMPFHTRDAEYAWLALIDAHVSEKDGIKKALGTFREMCRRRTDCLKENPAAFTRNELARWDLPANRIIDACALLDPADVHTAMEVFESLSAENLLRSEAYLERRTETEEQYQQASPESIEGEASTSANTRNAPEVADEVVYGEPGNADIATTSFNMEKTGQADVAIGKNRADRHVSPSGIPATARSQLSFLGALMRGTPDRAVEIAELRRSISQSDDARQKGAATEMMRFAGDDEYLKLCIRRNINDSFAIF